jgi:hypothetical protein
VRRAAASAPLPASVLALAVVLAPLAVARAGRALGAELAGAEQASGVANAIVLGPALGAAVGGAALAAALPARAALGGQLAAAPVGDLPALLALLAAPVMGLAVVILPSLGTGAVAVAAELRGGGDAGLALVAAIVAAAVGGAVVAEAGIALARGRAWPALAVAVGAAGWAALGLAIGCVPLGPLAAVPEALRDRGSAWPAVGLAGLTCSVLACVWLRLAAARPGPRATSARPTLGVVRMRRSAKPASLAAILGRRRDVRIAAGGAIAFGVGGIVLAAVTGAPSPGGLLLCTTTALLGAILAPLVVGGVLIEGRWLWAAAACSRRAIGVSALAVGIAAAAVPVLLVAALAGATVGAPPAPLAAVAGLTVVAAAAALVAGSLVPWRGEGAGDQVTTFAAFVAVAVVASLAVALVAPRLVSVGIPDPVVAAALCATAVALAAEALTRRIERAER